MAELYGNAINSNMHRPVEIFVSWDVGVAGAVGTVRGNYVTSVVLAGAGLYTITLDDRYQQLYGCRAIVMAISGAAEDLYCQLAAYNPSPAATGSTVQVECMTGNVQTNPAATDEIFVALTLSNSTLDP